MDNSMFNRVLNIVLNICIIGCILFGVITGVKVLYSYNMKSLENYNMSIMEFVGDVFKGRKPISEIEVADIPEGIKEPLIEYSKNTFYQDDESLLLFEDVSKIDKYYPEIEDIQKKYIKDVNGVQVLSDGYFSELESIIYTEAKMDDKETKVLMYSYIDSTKRNISDPRLELVGNDLYINPSLFSFDASGFDILYYKGYKMGFYKDALVKKSYNMCKNNPIFDTISQGSNIVDDGKTYCVFANDFDTVYTVTCEKRMGKLVGITISVK